MERLYFGDNLDVLRDHVSDESIDLIYLDPPFNSKRDYNLLFKSPRGHRTDAQIKAFEDTWHWGKPCPLFVRQITSVHIPEYGGKIRVCKHALASIASRKLLHEFAEGQL
jgi:hypothetical protein